VTILVVSVKQYYEQLHKPKLLLSAIVSVCLHYNTVYPEYNIHC